MPEIRSEGAAMSGSCEKSVSGTYEAVIGLEVHVEVKGIGKLFCGCEALSSAAPNTCVCPVCTGYPGALPSYNSRMTRMAVREGLMLGCEIDRGSLFDRKHYFYPDLPKGYQITQFRRPVCTGGGLAIRAEGGEKKIRLRRIHIEEDAAKLVYGADGRAIPDFNRAGVPLLEIVTEPDMRSADEAVNFAEKLRLYTVYAGVSDCRMNEGSMRVDVNVSLRKRGDPPGAKVELKNINSFSFMRTAITYEIRRQSGLLDRGLPVAEETRRFSEKSGTTEPMREKEDQTGYRYMPDTDLGPVAVSEKLIAEEAARLPEAPDAVARRYTDVFGLREEDAMLIISTPDFSDYYNGVCSAPEISGKLEKEAAKICISRIFTLADRDRRPAERQTAGIVKLVADGGLGSANVGRLIALAAENVSADPAELTAAHGLGVIRDEKELTAVVEKAIIEESRAAAQFVAGKEAALAAVIGKCMKLTGGRADPAVLDRLLKERLGRKLRDEQQQH